MWHANAWYRLRHLRGDKSTVLWCETRQTMSQTANRLITTEQDRPYCCHSNYGIVLRVANPQATGPVHNTAWHFRKLEFSDDASGCYPARGVEDGVYIPE